MGKSFSLMEAFINRQKHLWEHSIADPFSCVLTCTTLLEKYSNFFCNNLVDFNEAHLHEATSICMHEFFPACQLYQLMASSTWVTCLVMEWFSFWVISIHPGDMLDSTNSDPNFMNTIITGDESWVYGYDPETKSLSFSL